MNAQHTFDSKPGAARRRTILSGVRLPLIAPLMEFSSSARVGLPAIL
jgi:hypothetical protein